MRATYVSFEMSQVSADERRNGIKYVGIKLLQITC